MRCLLAPLACLVAIASGSAPAFAAPSLPSQFVVESATPGAAFTTPTAIAFLPGGRMLVAEKAGIVYSVTNGVKRTTPLWTRTNEVLNEHDRGLLGLAVDPNYVTNHYIYLLYTVDPDSNGVDTAPSDAFCRLVRYRISFTDSNTVDYTTRTILMGVSQRYGPLSASPSHTIGALRFGRDGSLLLTSGDGASYTQTDAGGLDSGDFGSGANKTDPYEDIGAFRAQSLSSLCGKVLRLNPANGAGYASNPYWDGNPYSVRSRVWAYGIRNPFRFCIRPGTGVADTAQGNPGTVVIGDVGYNTWEEMNIVRIPGANFGWPCYEGLGPQTNYQAATPAHNGCGSIGTADNPASVTAPMATWHHSNAALGSPAGFSGNCSIGGVFYTGNRYPAQYRGSYFFADYGQSWLKVATLDGSGQLVSIAGFGSAMDGPVDFTTDPSTGDIYYVAITTGEVRRLRYTGVVSNLPPVAVADGAPAFGVAPLSVTFSGTGSADPDWDPLTLSWLFGDGTGSSAANPSHVYASAGTYDCVLTADDGRGGIDRDTVRIIVSATSAFPTTGILDNFNRANGPVGGSWVGQTAGLVIDANSLAQTGGDAWPVWNGGVFGPDQEAYVTLTQTSATAPEQNLMLKIQGTNYTTGHVEVWYSAAASRVTVSSYLPATGWKVEGAVEGVLFAPGDQLGARALSNGIVQVFRNGVLRGSVSVASWPFAASGGRVGLSLSGASASRFDNFGGGSARLGENASPHATILAPRADSTFATGDTLWLRGEGSDAEDPATVLAYHWQLDLHHNNHVHPAAFASDAQSDFAIGENHDDGTGVYYEIKLIVTDTQGARDTAAVNAYPEIDLAPKPPIIAPELPLEGAPLGVVTMLHNLGRMPSPLVHWQLLVDGGLAAEGDTLLAGLDSVMIARTLSPGYLVGSHTMQFVADAPGAIHEPNEANNATTTPFSVIGSPTGVDAVTGALSLANARPNPTTGAASLRLTLPNAARIDFVVFDLSGREVWSAPSRRLDAGVHELRWPGTSDRSRRGLSPGLYLARVRVGSAEFTRRIVLTR